MKKLFTLSLAILFTILCFAQAQRLVLFEEFTGENCPPCWEINPAVNALAAAYPSEVVLLHYLAPIPTPGVLSQQVSGVVAGRMNYYGVNTTPWGQEDGLMWDSSLLATYHNNPSTWCINLTSGALNPDYLNNEYAVPSPFTITVNDTLTDATDSFYAAVTITAAQAISFTGALRLQMAMVENLNFVYPPGNVNETSWSNAVRAMYPSYAGTILSLAWTNGEVATYTFKGKMPAFIRDKSQVRFVAFIQNTVGAIRTVQQTGVSPYYSFNRDLGISGIQNNFGNCYSPQFTPVVNLVNVGTQDITSCYISRYVDNVFIDSVPWTGTITAGNSTNATLAPITIAAGVHKLTVIAANPNGQPDPNPANDSISLDLDIAAPEVNTPLIEGFENGDPIISGWAVESPDHDSTWRVIAVGDASAHSYMVDFVDDLSNDFAGAVNNLYAPPLNLTYAAHATVKFSFANQWINFGNGYGLDSLDIDVSTDCGNTWSTVYATNLATAPAQNVNTLTNFVPSSGQWKTDSANLSIAANHDGVLLRFRPQTFDGNNLYLDNVNIYKYDSVPYTAPSAIQPVSGIQSVSVYPNPTSSQVNIDMQLLNNAPVSYLLSDLTGKVITDQPVETKGAGANHFAINTSALADGAYWVTITAGNDRVSKLIAVIH